jgi:hypothetical protein
MPSETDKIQMKSINYHEDRSRFSQTQQFIYSLSTEQHVSALHAFISLPRMEEKCAVYNGN